MRATTPPRRPGRVQRSRVGVSVAGDAVDGARAADIGPRHACLRRERGCCESRVAAAESCESRTCGGSVV